MSDPGPDFLRTFLADRDTPCPGCGYNLRGLPGDLCPECNQSLSLRVGLTEPRLGALLAAASGLLSGVGASLVCLLIVGGFTLRWGPPPRSMFAVFILPTIMVAIDGTLAYLLLRPRGRVWFRMLRSEARMLAVLTPWAILMAAVVWFVLNVR